MFSVELVRRWSSRRGCVEGSVLPECDNVCPWSECSMLLAEKKRAKKGVSLKRHGRPVPADHVKFLHLITGVCTV